MAFEAIREDIGHNYHHTHEGHVLDRMAYALRKNVECIHVASTKLG